MRGSRSQIMHIVASIVIIVVAAVVLLYPIPYDLERVGGATDTSELISIGHDNNTGNILFTYVSVADARVYNFLTPIFNRDYRLTPEKDFVVPEDYYSREDYREERRVGDMTDSQLNALTVAFREAGQPFGIQSNGIYVNEVAPISSFYNEIQPGDELVSVNDKPFHDSYDLHDYIDTLQIGDNVTVDYRRNGELRTSTGKLTQDQSTGNPSLGLFYMMSLQVDSQYPIEIKSDSGVGGSSAGLMLSLEVYSQLTGDITKGRVIAGTGTIDRHGNVGRIGGVEMKVIAADRAGAEIFFVADDSITDEIAKLNPKIRSNYRDAVRAAIANKIDMEIVPVKTFSDAVHYLNQLP